MMNMMRRRLLMTAPLAALAGCDEPKVPIVGKQIPILPDTNGISVAADAPPVSVPAAVTLDEWPQVLVGPAHAPGNIAGPGGLRQAWRTSIGAGGGYRQPLQGSPVVAGGRIFTMDADGVVAALAPTSGAQIWRRVTRPKHVSVENIGGGIGYDAGTVYASTGYSELLAIDAASGNIRWRQPLDYPARSAPTIAGGIVAVVTQNDLLLTFDPASGTPGWRFTGRIMSSPTSVAAAGAPAFDSGILIAGFSSGTLTALDAGSGTPLWEQSMASSYSQASPLDFSDIVAAPVIAGGVVFAVGLGNVALAVDLHSGAKVWQHDVTGTQPIYVAGDFGYLLDVAQNLTAIHLADGLVSWTTLLPNFRNMKTHKGTPRGWNGPIMVNGQLLLTSSLGELISVDPVTGAYGAMTKLAGPADLPPVATGAAVLLLSRDATLTALS